MNTNCIESSWIFTDRVHFTTNNTDNTVNNYMEEYERAMGELGINKIESELETALKRKMSNFMYGAYSNHVNCKGFIIPKIKNVIFNPPATIVFWNDGTKTVVKCQNDEAFDPEKGITMAFFKKMHGNKGHYFEEIKKWTEKDGN